MIFCECYNDEVLLKALGKTRKQIKHKPNKSEACKSLKKENNSLSLIDEDPGKLQDKYSETLISVYYNNDISIREDTKLSNKVILLCPKLEPWLEKALKQAKIDRAKYHLPEDLHDIGTDDHKLSILQQMIEDALPNSPMLIDLKSKL